jgi:cytochrome c-type biogenesis protein CcmH
MSLRTAQCQSRLSFFYKGWNYNSHFVAINNSRFVDRYLRIGPMLGRSSSPFAKQGLRGICFSLILLAVLYATSAFAQKASDPAPLQFSNTTEEQRFHDLVAELRCVMCQNQSLADSNAQIAVDLRHEVLALMREGRSDADIRDFLVARYGEFVLYRPRVSGTTWLLWFGPLLFAFGGGVVVWRLLRRSGKSLPPIDDAQEW